MQPNGIKITTDSSARILAESAEAVTVQLTKPEQTLTVVLVDGAELFVNALGNVHKLGTTK